MDRLEYEKMRRRYLSPKSPFSERGLALASLNIFNVLPITNAYVSLSIFMDGQNMRLSAMVFHKLEGVSGRLVCEQFGALFDSPY